MCLLSVATLIFVNLSGISSKVLNNIKRFLNLTLRTTPGNDRGQARVLMRPLKATEPSCMMIRPRRRDCTLPYKVKIIALYTSDNKNVAPRERVLVDVATNEEWTKKCRNDEDYDVEVLDVKPDAKYDFVQIVIQQDVDRRDTSIGKLNIFLRLQTKSTSIRCNLHPNGCKFLQPDFLKTFIFELTQNFDLVSKITTTFFYDCFLKQKNNQK